MCKDMNVPFLGSLPLDPRVAKCCDEGKDFMTELSDSPVVTALNQITKGKYLHFLFDLSHFFHF